MVDVSVMNKICNGKFYYDNRIIINNQVLRKIKIAVESDVKNWAYISLR